MHTVEQSHKAFSLVDPEAKTATFNSGSVDCLERNADLMAILQLGAITGTSVTVDIKLTESDDDFSSDNSDIEGAVFTQFDETADNSLAAVNGRRTKRYVRAEVTIAGTTPSALMGLSLLVEAAKQGAAVNSATPA